MPSDAIKILLVEDSPSDAGILQENLHLAGLGRFDFTVLERLDEALERLRREAFHILLLDLSLPDSSGADTFRRARQAAPALPIVVLTGVDDDRVGLEAVREGIQDYLVKGQADGCQMVRVIRYAIERQQAEETLRRTTERLEVAHRASGSGVWDWDIANERIEWSPRMFDLFGLDPLKSAASFEAWRAVLHPDDREAAMARIDQALKTREMLVSDYRVICPDESLRWIRAFGQAVYNDHGQPLRMAGLCIDITDSKRREEELRRLNRALKALSHSNQAMMRAKNEAEYLQDVCRIIIEDCSYAMVWIGFAEEDEAKSVRPAACAGFEKGYLETLKITWADTERGRGPTGTAIRTGQPSLCRNMQTDPLFQPWREEALKRGYASSLVLPLKAGDRPFGAITIYSREPDPFSADEVRLLSELAGDLSSGIAAIRLRVDHERNEETLRQNEVLRLTNAYNRNLIEASPDPMVTIGPDGKITDVNAATEAITGCVRRDLIGTDFSDYFTEPEKARAGYQQVFREGLVRDYPLEIRHRNGRITPVHYNASVYRDETGAVRGVFAAARDMTERKKAEEERFQYQDRLRSLATTLAITEEEERRQISRQIHDTIIQSLSLSSIKLGAVTQALEQTALAEEQVRLKTVRELIDEAITQCRLLMSDLTPPMLYELGLAPALDDLIEKLRRQHGAVIELEDDGHPKPMPHALRGLLFQSARELVINALKHAGPCRITLSLKLEGDRLAIKVADNGVGFDHARPPGPAHGVSGGFGLFNIRERVEELGGRFEIQSQPGQGTIAALSVPLSPPEKQSETMFA